MGGQETPLPGSLLAWRQPPSPARASGWSLRSLGPCCIPAAISLLTPLTTSGAAWLARVSQMQCVQQLLLLGFVPTCSSLLMRPVWLSVLPTAQPWLCYIIFTHENNFFLGQRVKFPGLILLCFFPSVKGDQLMLLSDGHCRHHQHPGCGFTQQLILGIPADCQPNDCLFSAGSRCCSAPQFPCWREHCWDNPCLPVTAPYTQFWPAAHQRVSSLHDCPGELRDFTRHHFSGERQSLLTGAVVETGYNFFLF